MKNIFFLLIYSVLLYGCSNDADDTDTGLQDFTVIVNIDCNHSFGEFTQSVYAFLSDQDGVILDSAELKIGETTTLNFSGNSSSEYDLSYMKYADLDFMGEKFYTLTTFTNIDAGEYTIDPSQFIENSYDEISINLANTGYPCEVTSSNPGRGTFGPENGGYYNFSGNLVDTPTSDFYISFKSPNDQFERYFWQEDIAEGSVFNMDYNTLPEITSIVSVQTPSNDIYNFRLEGLMNFDIQNMRHSIREGNYPNGLSSISIPLPLNIFDNYLFDISFGNNDFQYFKKLHTSTIPSIIEVPELTFTVNNSSEANFNMTANGDAIIYDVIFRGSNSNETVSVAHQINGEVTSEINFSKRNLRMNIQQTYPEITGFETLPLGSVSMMHYSAINSYKDILKYRIQGKAYIMTENGSNEGVSKQFD